ncbi:protein SSUH2 homolog [Rana temporaria]|uniref:protein SSUH2 homolog n=1 Tax=Rana temporaria TaxID=8407 RepID=UPI001AACB82E|nr:protein SSUH2 homolog [Rana temporaria]
MRGPCQTSDTAAGRSVPQAWDVPVSVPRMFQDGELKMVMPLTSSVQACSTCNGLGRKMCLKCHGTGRAQCMWCNGRGRRMQMEVCQHCYGNGTESCRMCQNSNQQCDGCSGKGRVLTYMLLTVTWKNHVFELISDHQSEFSSDLFQNVKGEKLVMEEESKVSGITDFPDTNIIETSQNALERHRSRFSSCRVLRQRQSVERLPLTRVQYCWKEKQLSYFVYGTESKVFVQNYPKKCCCLVL